jgi:NTE family protein
VVLRKLSAAILCLVAGWPCAAIAETVNSTGTNDGETSSCASTGAGTNSTGTNSTGTTGAETASKPKSFALVIAGGGLKTVGAIGALKVLEREHVPISYIYGTSCGAVIGALYASGVPIKDIEAMFVSGKWQRVVGHRFVMKALSLPLRGAVPGLERNKWPGVLAGDHYEKFLKANLPSTFAELKIPFRAVAVDLCTGDNVCLRTGDLPHAVLASCAMPPLVKPVEWGNALLVDGGVRGNLPVALARQNNEGDIIIACSSAGQIRLRSKEYFRSIPKLNRRAADILFHQTDTTAMNDSDILIEPDIDDVPMMTKDPKKVQAAIDAGELAAVRNLHSIRQAMAETGSKAF